MNSVLRTLFFGPALALAACSGGSAVTPEELSHLTLPEGFHIAVYAADVPGARSMTLADDGTLFVGTRTKGKVYAVRDTDGDHVAETVITAASGLHVPNGVAYRDGSLFVAEISRVLRFDDVDGLEGELGDPVVVRNDLPRETHHGWKFIRFGPDGKLYVPVGAPCNVCDEEDERFASILCMNPDGSDLEVFAHGVRNTVGFDWNPGTGELWFTDNGRDWLGDDSPADELNHAPESGLHFGFPFCHGGDTLDPEFGEGHTCSSYVPPAQKLGPHVASLGMRFYTGTQFPSTYQGQIFIAEHGSWNSSVPVGYRVTLVKLEDGKAVSYEPFVEGWLDEGDVSGRPVDVQVMPDGTLLVSDDHAGMIYRIWYE